jgi:hypothetical protein
MTAENKLKTPWGIANYEMGEVKNNNVSNVLTE